MSPLAHDLLASPSFDVDAANTLARRDLYSAAADYLQTVSGCGPSLIRTMLVSQNVAPYRVAQLTGALPPEARLSRPLTIADLRAMATPEARLAMIVLGALAADWSTATRRERAVIALRHIVQRLFAEAA